MGSERGFSLLRRIARDACAASAEHLPYVAILAYDVHVSCDAALFCDAIHTPRERLQIAAIHAVPYHGDDCEDCDHDHQFNERESLLARWQGAEFCVRIHFGPRSQLFVFDCGSAEQRSLSSTLANGSHQ